MASFVPGEEKSFSRVEGRKKKGRISLQPHEALKSTVKLAAGSV